MVLPPRCPSISTWECQPFFKLLVCSSGGMDSLYSSTLPYVIRCVSFLSGMICICITVIRPL